MAVKRKQGKTPDNIIVQNSAIIKSVNRGALRAETYPYHLIQVILA